MEKNSAKISLGTAVCIFIIIVLIIALAIVYYLGFIKYTERIANAENAGDKAGMQITNIVDNENNKELNTENTKQNNTTQKDNFNLLYDALYKDLTEMKNGAKSYIVSDNKIEEFIILGIEMENEKYFYGENWVSTEYPDEYSDDNLIIGSYSYALKFDTLEGLQLAGSKGSAYRHVEDWLIDSKTFIYNKTTQDIEIITGF